MAENPEVSMEEFKFMADRAGLAMDQAELEHLKPIYELYMQYTACLLYTSPSPRDRTRSRMPSSA